MNTLFLIVILGFGYLVGVWLFQEIALESYEKQRKRGKSQRGSGEVEERKATL